jgi:hypothetical protein
MSADQLVGGILVVAGVVALLAVLAWIGLEWAGRMMLKANPHPSHDQCDYCHNPDPHGLELVRNTTGRLRLVCRGCAVEGAALGAHVVLERGRKGGR